MDKDCHLIFEKYTLTEFYKKFGTPGIYKIDDGFKHIRNGFVRFTKDKDGQIPHKLDGPAIEAVNGYEAWFKDGQLHREDGPAITWVNGDKEYFINGREIKNVERFKDNPKHANIANKLSDI